MAKDTTEFDDEIWRYLIEERAISRENLTDLRAHLQHRPWKRLGAILVEMGLLNIKQVSRLLRIQADDMSSRIGDLAIREGYCTPREIQEAADRQFETNVSPILLLAEDAGVQTDKLLRGLVRYIHHLETRLESIPVAPQ